MKFDCGPSYGEWFAAREKWRRWFAWRPVFVASHDCRWLETVEVKGTYHSSIMGGWWEWHYRPLKQSKRLST
jgi:hypothetical protein